MANAKAKLYYTSSKYIDQLPITNGNIIFVPDANMFCLDMSEQRFTYTTIRTFATEAARAAVPFPNEGFYFVEETKVFGRWNNGWSQITPSNLKPVVYGTTVASTGAGASWRAGAVVSFVYDGTNGVEVSSIDDNTDVRPTAYCDTAAGTQAKVASCSNYKLRSGARFPLLLVNTNTYDGKITLNVNSTGAKDLYINGTVSSSSNKTGTQGMYSVYYDGSYYYVRTDTTHNPNGGVCVGASTVTPDPDTKIGIKE